MIVVPMQDGAFLSQLCRLESSMLNSGTRKRGEKIVSFHVWYKARTVAQGKTVHIRNLVFSAIDTWLKSS